MAEIDVWSNFKKGQDTVLAPQLAQLQQMTGAVNAAGALRKLQMETQMRQELAGASQDQLPTIAAKYASPGDLLKNFQESANVKSQTEARKEVAKNNLLLKQLIHGQDYELKLRSATTAEQRLAIEAWDKQVRAQIASERLKDDTGVSIPIPSIPAAQQPAPIVAPQAAPVPAAPAGISPVSSGIAELNANVPAQTAQANVIRANEAQPNGGGMLAANTVVPSAPPPPVEPLTQVAEKPLVSPLQAQLGPQASPLLSPKAQRKIATDVERARQLQASAPQRSAEAMRDDVYYQITNGVPRPGSVPTGRQGEGNAYRAQFADELHKVAKELNLTPEELATKGRENKAKFMALGAVEKDLSSIRPYNDMLHLNGDIAIKLAEKAVATDSKLLNKSINWIRQNAGDNPDVAEFLAQAQIVSTESARVLNNPRLVGQLTDSARHEMDGIVKGNMPIESFTRVVKRMQADGNNRVTALESQRKRTVSEIRGETPATRASDAAPTI